MTANTKEKKDKVIFAGDRDLAVDVLKFILESGVRPLALMVPDRGKASHAEDLISLCSHLDKSHIIEGAGFKSPEGINFLSSLDADYIVSIHYPYIYPAEVLRVPKYGAMNLHPAYLPFTRGWHTSSWAIWDEVPFGATLHFMNEGLDTGDIIHQKELEVLPEDTADSAYKKAKQLELEVFKEAWPSIVSGDYQLKVQSAASGTFHKKKDLSAIQKIDLEEFVKAKDLIKKIRALTTNNIEEGAYFESGGQKYRLQIRIKKED